MPYPKNQRSRYIRPDSGMSSIFEQASVRGRLYGLFSLVFRHRPSPALIELIKQEKIMDALGSLPGIEDELVQLQHLFKTNSVVELNHILGVAYTRLFVTPGTRIIPFQSAYIENTLLWGPETLDVIRYYSKAGFRVPDGEIPDHIGVELRFMQHLCTAQDPGVPQLFDIEIEFFNNHLSTWAPGFFEDVRGSGTNVFYVIMADLAGRFIEMVAQEITAKKEN